MKGYLLRQKANHGEKPAAPIFALSRRPSEAVVANADNMTTLCRGAYIEVHSLTTGEDVGDPEALHWVVYYVRFTRSVRSAERRR